jgi:hypothetical protein
MTGQMKEPMSTVGQIEKKTQQRVVRLFREQLGYDYLGDWTERDGSSVGNAGEWNRIARLNNRIEMRLLETPSNTQ